MNILDEAARMEVAGGNNVGALFIGAIVSTFILSGFLEALDRERSGSYAYRPTRCTPTLFGTYCEPSYGYGSSYLYVDPWDYY